MADISTAGGILSAETIQALVVEPLMRESVGTQVSTIVSASSHSTRFPIVQQDPSSGWTAEGAEIDVSDPTIDELNVISQKLATLVVVSNELVSDSDLSALDVVGQGLTRDLQIRLDAAFRKHGQQRAQWVAVVDRRADRRRWHRLQRP
jgi:HK97 family phage major capsid protein